MSELLVKDAGSAASSLLTHPASMSRYETLEFALLVTSRLFKFNRFSSFRRLQASISSPTPGEAAPNKFFNEPNGWHCVSFSSAFHGLFLAGNCVWMARWMQVEPLIERRDGRVGRMAENLRLVRGACANLDDDGASTLNGRPCTRPLIMQIFIFFIRSWRVVCGHFCSSSSLAGCAFVC